MTPNIEEFGLVPVSGEWLILVAALCTWIVYILVLRAQREKMPVDRALWFGLWMAFFVKSVRSDHLVTAGNLGILGLGLALLTLTTRRRAYYRGGLIPILMMCVLVYAGLSLFWYLNDRNVKVMIVTIVIWCAVLRYFGCTPYWIALRNAFSGFVWLAVLNAGLWLVYIVFRSDEGVKDGIRLVGPFGASELPRNGFVLLGGLLFLTHDTTATMRHLLTVTAGLVVLITTLTLSRAGAALSYVYVLTRGNPVGRIRMLVTACVLMGCIAIGFAYIDASDILEARLVQSTDGGRLDSLKVILEAAEGHPMYGHGFLAASIDTFLDANSTTRIRGYSSHCFGLSILYEFGYIGGTLCLGLFTAVSSVLFVARKNKYARDIFWLWICFGLSGLFENSVWWPTTPLGLLATLLMGSAFSIHACKVSSASVKGFNETGVTRLCSGHATV